MHVLDPHPLGARHATRTVAALLAALAVLAGLAVPAPRAEAAAGDPLRERGVVSRVVDGDTIDVRVDGSSTDTRVRLAGIQAFEAGECGADIATDRLRTLVEGERVELRAVDAGSSSLGRPVRSVHLPLASGGTADITEVMLLEGMGLWFPMEPEVTDTDRYNVAATHARLQGRGIWNDTLCGAGPQAGHDFAMWAKSDADSVDNDNLDDEYVVIVNRDTQTLELGGWLLRESSQFRQNGSGEGYRLPAGTSVAPGGRLTVRVGSGSDTATTLHMGSTTPLFDNADRTNGLGGPADNRGMGDGVYLLDPRGNVRGAFTWPCVVDCSTPLAGKLVIDHVEYDPSGVDTADTEYVRLRNTSSSRIELDGYQLRNITVAHEFAPNTFLDAGETLTVRVGSGQDTRTAQYWGRPDAMLANSGDRVDVLSFDERFVDCADWGSGRDCPWPVTVPGAGTTGDLPTAPELGGDGGGEPEPEGPFADVRADATHAESIAWLVDEGITRGCADELFCPNARVPRAQMATFLTEALELQRDATPRFDDVRYPSTHAGAIGAIANAGITSGCAAGAATFCPDLHVTREQMATFLTEAFDLQRRDTPRFDDVRYPSTHAGAIGAIAHEGITSGCAGSSRTFCPTDYVTRAQMATFLKAALDG